MLRIPALAVARQNLDDPAVGNQAVIAGNHRLQLVSQGRVPGDPILHLLKVGLGNIKHLAAGAVQPRRGSGVAYGVHL